MLMDLLAKDWAKLGSIKEMGEKMQRFFHEEHKKTWGTKHLAVFSEEEAKSWTLGVSVGKVDLESVPRGCSYLNDLESVLDPNTIFYPPFRQCTC